MPPSPASTTTGTATILFTDLVGSTTLRTELGEERAEAHRQAHHRLLSETIAKHRGTLHDDLGDGIMASFASAADAVAAAVAMQQTITAGPPRGGTRGAVRIGISVGDVAWDGTHPHGMPLVEAARLCAAAEGGQILVADTVRAVTHGRGGHRFAPSSMLTLKGLAYSLAASVVEWDPLPRSGSVPLPSLLARSAELTFTGRDAELAALHELWTHADRGERRTVLLAGEPGIGKTRLAAEFAGRVHAEGATVLYGHCDDELGVPFQPFVAALRYFVEHTPTHHLRERLGRHPGDLVRLVPEMIERAPDLPPPLKSDAETERYRLFEAIASWLATASREEPILVVLDDLHWAVRPTLLLLRHVVRARDPARLLLIGTYRDTELDRAHPLADTLVDLRRDGTATRVVLRGLDLVGVATLLAAATSPNGIANHEVLAHALHGESEGNPFFVGELVRHLRETGALVERDNRWTTTRPVEQLGIPEGVKEVVGRRLSRLSPEANDVLTTASVIGRSFRLLVLERVLDLPEHRLLTSLREATDARLVEETGVGVYHFAHALVRSTLYEELGITRRVRLHRRIGETIETVDANRLESVLGELAFHYRQAAAGGDVAKAVEYAMQAGRHAAASLAYDQAATHYEQALELVDDEALRGELRILLGEAQRDAGDGAYRQTLLDAAADARRRGDTDRLARAAIANTRGYATATLVSDEERISMLEAALAAVPDDDSPVRAELLATLAVESVYSSDRDRRTALCNEAVAMARRLGDPVTLTRTLRARSRALLSPDTLSQRLADTAERVAISTELGDLRERISASIDRFSTALEASHIDEVDRHLAVLEHLVEETALPTDRWSLRRRQSVRALLAGSTDEAERFAGEAFEIGRASGQPDASLVYGAQISSIRMVEGRLEEIEPALQGILARNPNGLTRAVVAHLYCELGRLEQAETLLARDAANDFADIPYEVAWLTAMTGYARVAAETRSARAAQYLYDRLAPWRAHIDCPGNTVNGSVARYLALLAASLGHLDDATMLFNEALRAHERIRAPYWIATTRLEKGRMLLERAQLNDQQQARLALQEALGVARLMGFASVARRATELLRRAS